MNPIRVYLLALAALTSAATLASTASANPGAQVLRGGGGPATGSFRVSAAPLTCLGANAADVLAEVTTNNDGGGDNALQVVVKPDGSAHFSYGTRFTYAVYPAPGANLPNPGDPGFLFSGSTNFRFETNVDRLTPDQFGQFVLPVAIPIELQSADGTNVQEVFYDVLLVVTYVGDQTFVGAATVGGRCP
jgi:hypothetical protein